MLCFTFSDFGFAISPSQAFDSTNPQEFQPEIPARVSATKTSSSLSSPQAVGGNPLDPRSATKRGAIRPDGFRRLSGEQQHSGMTEKREAFGNDSLNFLPIRTIVKKSTAPAAKDTTPPKILTLSAYADEKTGTVVVDDRRAYPGLFGSSGTPAFRLEPGVTYEYWLEIWDKAGNKAKTAIKTYKVPG